MKEIHDCLDEAACWLIGKAKDDKGNIVSSYLIASMLVNNLCIESKFMKAKKDFVNKKMEKNEINAKD